MREIKFRAFDKATNKMIATGFHVIGEVTMFSMIESYLYKNPVTGKATLERHADVTLMQYTGFKNPVGVEIYDGDIIKSPLGNVVKVFFGSKEYKLAGLPKGLNDLTVTGWLVENAKGSIDVLDDSFASGEVIGNIYQNPDLLAYEF